MGLRDSDDRRGHPGLEELNAFHDSEIDPSGRLRVERHLSACPACRARLADLQRVDEVVLSAGEDVPAEVAGGALEERIMARLRAGDAGDGSGEAAERREVGLTRPPFWRRLTGSRGPSPGWAAATAAAIGIAILATRELSHQSAPLEPTLTSRRQAEAPDASMVEDGVKNQAESMEEGGATKPEGTPAEPPVRPVPDVRGRTNASPAEDHPVTFSAAGREAGAAGRTGREAPAAEKPPGTRGEDAEPAVTWGAVEQKSSPAPAGAVQANVAPAPPDDPQAYAALVTTTLEDSGRARLEDRDRMAITSKPAAEGVAPPESLRDRLAFRDARSGREKPAYEDFKIAYAAAFRALEAGQFDLALQGFELISRGLPESDLAREADYQSRLTRVRLRLAAGEDPEAVLEEVVRGAEESFMAAERNRDRRTCREALAAERVRLTLLNDLRPRSDHGFIEERISRLRRCS